MKITIATPMGYMSLKDERMAENAKAAYANSYTNNEIEERVIMESKVKSHYKLATPFGQAYLVDYSAVCCEKRIIKNSFKEQNTKDICFVEAF